jgi:transcriptional regulator with XRE-family HTH domain
MSDPRPPSAAVQAWRAKCPLKKWLDERDVSAADLAKKLELIRQTVHVWLAGRSLPDAFTIRALWRLTGITFDQWFDWFEKAPADAPIVRKGTKRQAGRRRGRKPSKLATTHPR